MGKIIWHGNEVEKAVNKILRKKLNQACLHTVGEIKKVITEKKIVDTGLLRSSISYTMDDGTQAPGIIEGTEYPSKPSSTLSAHIGTRVFYAPYHEFGTRFIKPRPFIRPGFERAKKKIKQIFGIKENL